jgi:hypothetical protein
MLPTALETAMALRGSWRMMNEGERALEDFDVSGKGLLRSFGAILLTAPAFVAFLAAERLRAGLSNQGGLFDAPDIAVQLVAITALSFLLLPLAILLLFWRRARTARGTGFVICWNWTEVVITALLATPAALLAAGAMTPALAAVFTIAFAAIATRLRYAVLRASLGVAAPIALMVTVATFAAEIGLASAMAVGRF